MQAAAERGGPFGHGDTAPAPVVPRNWMRAAAPGIAFRRRSAESSPVGSSRAAWPRTAHDRGRVPRRMVARVLGLCVWLVRDRAR
jgi:hypothetical protein